jgi:hypothetical protein
VDPATLDGAAGQLGRDHDDVNAGIVVYDSADVSGSGDFGDDGLRTGIYSPWGAVSWVTGDQFVNNQLGGLTPGDNLNTADGLELPW